MERERREEEEGNPYRSFSRDVRIPTLRVVSGRRRRRAVRLLGGKAITASTSLLLLLTMCVCVCTVKPGHGDICLHVSCYKRSLLF